MTFPRFFTCFVILVSIACGLLPGRAQTQNTAPVKPDDLIQIMRGDLPIILSAPHGGRMQIPGIPDRKGGEGIQQFVTATDTGTLEFAETLAASVEKEMGAKPYLIAAKFLRKNIDVNRPAKDAFEVENAQPVYNAYHDHIQKAVQQVKKDFGRGLLLDIHGQGKDEKTIFRGTAKKTTVIHLLDRFGKPALTGEKSILGILQKNGHKVFPPGDSDEPEDPAYSGGYTVRTYGSSNTGSVDAIQLELGFEFRSRPNRQKFADELAKAIKVFAGEYLPAKK